MTEDLGRIHHPHTALCNTQICIQAIVYLEGSAPKIKDLGRLIRMSLITGNVPHKGIVVRSGRVPLKSTVCGSLCNAVSGHVLAGCSHDIVIARGGQIGEDCEVGFPWLGVGNYLLAYTLEVVMGVEDPRVLEIIVIGLCEFHRGGSGGGDWEERSNLCC